MKKAVFGLTVLVAVLAVSELLCRLLGLGGPGAVDGTISEWHHRPDGRTFWVTRGPGYNSDGMRDAEHDAAKPPGVFRIICLGDSVTAGHGVARTESYPFLFGRFLRQLGLKTEVLNVAVSGWSTLQEATAYRSIARRYAPDHVFLGFCLNDVAEMHNNLTRPPSPVGRFLSRHSALARWLVDAEGRQISNVRELFTRPDAPAVVNGWRRVFDALRDLRRSTREDGCALSVVVFPFRFQVGADPPEPVAQRALIAFCRAEGIPCMDMLPVLRPLGPAAFVDASHLSPRGAAAAAEALVQWGRSGCAMCGLDLTGVTGDACPRCGARIAPPGAAP